MKWATLMIVFEAACLFPTLNGGSLPDTELPLGRKGIPESRLETVLRPGLVHVHIERGIREGGQLWALSSFVLGEIHEGVQCYAPGRKWSYEILQCGSFSSAEEARESLARSPDREAWHVSHKVSEANWDSGPWTLDVLILDPGFYKGRVVAALVDGLNKTSVLARRYNAAAAINGGYFDADGRPTSISITQGELRHAPDRTKPALLISKSPEQQVTAKVVSGEEIEAVLRSVEFSLLNAVGGGPTLVRNGEPVYEGNEEGWEITPESAPEQIRFIHNWYNRRNPRTAVGVSADGCVFFLTIDGREYDTPADGRLGSVGATIDEIRTLMQFLGARDALNLDGGGSTTLVIDGEVINRPSDPTGERPVGDVILFLDE